MAWHTGQTLTSHNTAKIARELDTKIYEPDANVAPFLWLCNQNKKTTTQPKFESFYRAAQVRKDTVGAAGALSTATTIPVDIPRLWRVYDCAYNVRTGECIYVTDVDVAASTLTVQRGVGSTAAAMNDNDVLQITGSAAPEGDTRLAAVSGEVSELYNYTQIYKHTVQISRTRAKSADYGIDELQDQIALKERLHYMEMEASFLFQGRHIISSSDDVIRFTGGIIPSLSTGTHVKNEGSTLSLAEFDTWAHPIFTFGNDNQMKIGLCNSFFLGVFNTLAGDYLQKDMDPKMREFGWKFMDYVTYYGKVRFHEHRLLTRMFPTSGVCLLVDPDYIRTRTLTDSDTSFYIANNVKKKDSTMLDGVIGEYLTEAGLETQGIFDVSTTPAQCAHGWLYGVTGAAV